jgi:hypothetical protein
MLLRRAWRAWSSTSITTCTTPTSSRLAWATSSHEVKRDGKGFVETADFCTNRINIETEDGVVVETSAG